MHYKWLAQTTADLLIDVKQSPTFGGLHWRYTLRNLAKKTRTFENLMWDKFNGGGD